MPHLRQNSDNTKQYESFQNTSVCNFSQVNNVTAIRCYYHNDQKNASEGSVVYVQRWGEVNPPVGK